MNTSPPAKEKAKIGDVWVHPLTRQKFVFNGETWEPWELENQRAEYEKGEQ